MRIEYLVDKELVAVSGGEYALAAAADVGTAAAGPHPTPLLQLFTVGSEFGIPLVQLLINDNIPFSGVIIGEGPTRLEA